MQTYLDRYLAGECEEVWAELDALGEAVRREPHYSDAKRVAHETMRRVRYNLDLLIVRLPQHGYQFASPKLGERGWTKPRFPTLAAPPRNVQKLLAKLEQSTGDLPLSLRAFYEVVGGVYLVGHYPQWDDLVDLPYGLDALVVLPLSADLIEDCLDAEEGDTFEIMISPDYNQKYGISGSAYFIEIPTISADALLHSEWHTTTFVNYLRICLRWAGFPGLEMHRNPPPELPSLTQGLLPF